MTYKNDTFPLKTTIKRYTQPWNLCLSPNLSFGSQYMRVYYSYTVGLQFGSHRKVILRWCETRRASLSGKTGSISRVPPSGLPFLENSKPQVGNSLTRLFSLNIQHCFDRFNCNDWFSHTKCIAAHVYCC